MAFSKIQIVGNLGRDPELRYTPNGRPVTEFSVAVNQSTKNQQTGEWVEATDWFRLGNTDSSPSNRASAATCLFPDEPVACC